MIRIIWKFVKTILSELTIKIFISAKRWVSLEVWARIFKKKRELNESTLILKLITCVLSQRGESVPPQGTWIQRRMCWILLNLRFNLNYWIWKVLNFMMRQKIKSADKKLLFSRNQWLSPRVTILISRSKGQTLTNKWISCDWSYMWTIKMLEATIAPSSMIMTDKILTLLSRKGFKTWMGGAKEDRRLRFI